ncbi:putative Peptidase S8/S53 domain-containing protein [Seiridium cardinale]|uniref:Peptidase S8/S53 domain-containing protein n=1 Tax=Seiridium cardinale TaxID=138064 RepID=A0ABR2X9D2_9PEZI
MVSVPSILIALLTLTSWTFAANAHRSVRKPADGKAFYTVYPSDSVSVSTTEDFVKKTVGTDGLLPSTDDSKNFVSWIVEASPAEVDMLNSNTAIHRVVHFDPPNKRDEAVVQQLADRDDAVQTFAVFPVDRKDADKCAKTEKFMKDLINDDYYPHPFVYKNQTYYWTLKMTNAQRDEVAKGPGIRRIEADHKVELARAMPPNPSPVAQLSDSRKYRTFDDAAQMMGQESIANMQSSIGSIRDLNKLTNYVYESHQGDGSYVYHMELGVAFKNQASEFPNVVPDQQHLQPDLAKQLNWKPWEDHAPPKAHGTCTADKAVGAKYGSSKKAKLVVVQSGELGLLEINDATRKILADITDKADRKKKSVVSISMTGDPADPDSDIQDLLEESLQELFALDVPVITASGNDRKNEPDVDTIPAQWARSEYPLIVVGSVDFDGKRSDFSQGGAQVTIHAPDKDVTCVPESGNEPSTGRSGTSFATPLVAGEVSNLLSYETVPLDTSDGSLVKSLRQYLAEDKASWKRVEETAIWNGVDEAHNPTVAGFGGNSGGGSGGGSSNTPPPLHKECTGLRSKKYVSQPELKRLIEDEFCPIAVK